MWIPEEEYNNIKKKMPVPCVDLIIENNQKEVLLVQRKNEPAKNMWWFPGGRVMHGETRKDAAVRKLKEECGMVAMGFEEWPTLDVFLYDNEAHYNSHAISTFFICNVANQPLHLDSLSIAYEWKTPAAWNK